MVAAAALLLAGGAAVVLVFDPFGSRNREDTTAAGLTTEPEATDVTMSEPAVPDAEQPVEGTESAEPADSAGDVEPAEPEPLAEPEEAVEPAKPETQPEPEQPPEDAAPPSIYTVHTGDTLFDIAAAEWGDAHAWPLLLLANESSVLDPDLLSPGQAITVPAFAGAPFTDSEIETLSRAHLLAYSRYRELGLRPASASSSKRNLGPIRINKSLWVLYSGLRYNPQLIDQYRGEIQSEDVTIVESFVQRFGYPPDP